MDIPYDHKAIKMPDGKIIIRPNGTANEILRGNPGASQHFPGQPDPKPSARRRKNGGCFRRIGRCRGCSGPPVRQGTRSFREGRSGKGQDCSRRRCDPPQQHDPVGHGRSHSETVRCGVVVYGLHGRRRYGCGRGQLARERGLCRRAPRRPGENGLGGPCPKATKRSTWSKRPTS